MKNSHKSLSLLGSMLYVVGCSDLPHPSDEETSTPDEGVESLPPCVICEDVYDTDNFWETMLTGDGYTPVGECDTPSNPNKEEQFCCYESSSCESIVHNGGYNPLNESYMTCESDVKVPLWVGEHPRDAMKNRYCQEQKGYDTFCCGELVISDEESGLAAIVNELSEQGFVPELQDGMWTVYLNEMLLIPDLRFYGVNPGYSYFEFSSEMDPGVGLESEFPLYREILPDTERQIREQVREVLGL